jgi:CDP-2,3-bis-(O-geranylgeranyl)-sn-glycerol synthase
VTFARLIDLAAFLAPAYAANMAPPLVRFWKGWNPPLHRRWLGSHKTVLGLAAGLAAALAMAWVLSLVGAARLQPAARPWWLHGLLCGAGALGGDACKSFFKRRRGIPPGGRWIPFDQLDFQIGALLLAGHGAGLGARDVAVLLAGGFLGALAVNHLAFRLGIKQTMW